MICCLPNNGTRFTRSARHQQRLWSPMQGVDRQQRKQKSRTQPVKKEEHQTPLQCRRVDTFVAFTLPLLLPLFLLGPSQLFAVTFACRHNRHVRVGKSGGHRDCKTLRMSPSPQTPVVTACRVVITRAKKYHFCLMKLNRTDSNLGWSRRCIAVNLKIKNV